MAEIEASSIQDHESNTAPLSKHADSIAIVGMACRWPGSCNTPSALWDLLLAGKSAQCPVPQSRFNVDAFYHPQGQRSGSMNTTAGFFLKEDPREFDPSFFNISAAEASSMDPQQRKLLEVVYEAFEAGGQRLDSISGGRIGVYVGNFSWEHSMMILKDPEYLPSYATTGYGVTILSNRISHAFGLTGPSLTIDTACSSSLYALHLACMGLESGDCTSAVVGGVNLVLGPEGQLSSVKLGVLSPTSICHSFDSAADGYARGEGVGAIYLKKLGDALRDGDPIRAVIRGTAVNSNGKTGGGGISHPSVKAQEDVIFQAYKRAGLDQAFDETGYFECHGTGTEVGDPLEIAAVGKVFAAGRSSQKPLLVGSIKSSLGHGEASSGLAGIMKAVLILENGVIPATVGVREVNKNIDFQGGRIKVCTEATQWPEHLSLKRISINSFGYGGANGHAILEGIQSMSPGYLLKPNSMIAKIPIQRRKIILPYSAHDPDSLKENIAKLSSHSNSHDLAALAHTLIHHRTKFFYRGFRVIEEGESCNGVEGVSFAEKLKGSQQGIVMAFTGQGAQWKAMGREMMDGIPAFSRTVQQLDEVLQSLPKTEERPLGWTLKDLLMGSSPLNIDEPLYAQPLCTALQIGIVNTLRSWGTYPTAVIGHSSGEIAAAYASGYLTQAEAITIAYYRGYAVNKTIQISEGMMAAIGLGVEDVDPYLATGVLGESLTIACNNSPESVTLSGDKLAVEKAIGLIKRENPSVFARGLRTNGIAYHSHHMKSVGEKYETYLQQNLPSLSPTRPRIAEKASCVMYSTVRGHHEMAMEDGFSCPIYWRRNLESRVEFGPVMERLIDEDGFRLVLEIGPHSVLSGPVRQVSKKVVANPREVVYIPTVIRNSDSLETLMTAAGELWARDFVVDLAAVNGLSKSSKGVGAVVVDLPAYSWNYKRLGLLWTESRLSREFRFRKYPRHDLLGSRVPGTAGTWRNILSVESPGCGWLSMHRLGTQVIFPAAGYLAMAVEALSQHLDILDYSQLAGCIWLKDISLLVALTIPKDGVEVVLNLTPTRLSNATISNSSYDFSIFSIGNVTEGFVHTAQSQWALHCSGIIGHGPSSLPNTTSYESLVPHAPLHYSSSSQRWYSTFSNCGLNYGESFCALSDIFTNPQARQATGTLPLEPGHAGFNEESRYALHPTSIDMCLQMTIIAGHAGLTRNMKTGYVPTSFEFLKIWPRVRDSQGKGSGQVRAYAEKVGPKEKIMGHCELKNESGEILVEFENIQLTTYSAGYRIQKSQRNPYLRIVWKPDIRTVTSSKLEELLQPAIGPPSIIDGSQQYDDSFTQHLTRIIDLISHKKPTMKILELGGAEGHLTRVILDTMHHLDDYSFPRYGKYVFTDKTEERFIDLRASLEAWPAVEVKLMDLSKDEIKSSDQHYYDLILAVNPTNLRSLDIASNLQKIRRLLKTGGHFLTLDLSDNLEPFESQSQEIPTELGRFTEDVLSGSLPTSSWPNLLSSAGFSSLYNNSLKDSHTPSFILATATIQSQRASSLPRLQKPSLVFVYRDRNVPISLSVAQIVAMEMGSNIVNLPLSDVVQAGSDIFKNSIVVVTVELKSAPFFPTMTEDEFQAIQYIIGSSRLLLWLTEGGYIDGEKPDCGMMPGLARTIMAEQPALKLYTMDFSIGSVERDINGIANMIFDHIMYMQTASELPDDVDDYHLVEKNGILHVSRIIPDAKSNIEFTHSINEEKEMAVFGSMPMKMKMEQVGNLDSIYFVEDVKHYDALLPGYVEVKVNAVGMNAKDTYIALGHFDSKDKNTGEDFFNIECAGNVARMAPDVENLSIGDSVICLGFGHYGTYCRVQADLCQKVPADADFVEVATLPIVFSTALYAFNHLARLSRGQSVLIHSAAGGLGIAAVQIAKLLGANVYATVSTPQKREFLQREFGIPASQIFYSRDSSFVSGLLKETGGKGVDVLLTSSSGDVFHDSMKCVTSHGMVIDIGRKETIGNGRLEMGVFKKGITITSFDLNELGWAKPKVLQELLREVVVLYNSGLITPISPVTIYDISELGKALRHSSMGNHIGKLVITYHRPESLVRSLKSKPSMRFRPDSAYLLIGALGGLGRSLCQWMVSRGARNLVFISRSGAGAPNSPASLLLQDLEASGVRVQLIRGDVTNLQDVRRTITASEKPIRGVVMGAMVVEHGVFTGLQLEEFKRVVKPKVEGSWALHEAFKEMELDFFVMMSSLAGAIGVPSEAAYCGANAVMDCIARHRYSQNLPVTSLALGMITEVGYISERAEREQGLTRAGLYGIPEAEFLRAMELAMVNSYKRPKLQGHEFSGDPCANSYLLMGMEPIRLKELHKAGFTGIGYWKKDARFSIITNELQHDLDGGTNLTKLQSSMEILKAAAKISSREVVKGMLEGIFYEQLANLLLLGSVEQLDPAKSAAEYGMDSIIGAELRHWMHRELGVEMSHLELLSPVGVGVLAGRVFDKMDEGMKGLEK